LREAGLVDQILDILKEEGLPAKNLELEITESLAMQDPALAIRMIRILRDAGISVAVDDFGTGHSSPSSLKRFNFSRLKIDRSFIQEIAVEPESRAIVRAILGISEALGLATVAEGVENAEQLDTLRELGCEDSQGFLLAIPMPAEDATRWMEANAPLNR
jgi:EAL domain-containing protein (putative c-di-GMP-specific phosphodiesterase class I)